MLESGAWALGDFWASSLDCYQTLIETHIILLCWEEGVHPLPDPILPITNQVMEDIMEWSAPGKTISIEERVKDAADILADLRTNSRNSAFFQEIRKRI